MQHLFGPEGVNALARALQQRPLLAFDFDGTLTPIVARPGDARLTKAVSARLEALAALLPLAIVTGRSVQDVRGRLGFNPRFIVGNHGAEGLAAGIAESDVETAPDPALARIRSRLRAMAPALQAAGVTPEDKGHSLALHYRLARSRQQALQAISALLTGNDEGLRVFGGKLVVNVATRHAPDKADAVHALVRQSQAEGAIFAGDDVNDEAVFARAPAHWLTIRVGRDDPQSNAQYRLDSPGEMALLLGRMLALLQPR